MLAAADFGDKVKPNNGTAESTAASTSTTTPHGIHERRRYDQKNWMPAQSTIGPWFYSSRKGSFDGPFS
jgi:hypothetical protein